MWSTRPARWAIYRAATGCASGLLFEACTPVVRDDFTSSTISADWFLCERDENEFTIIKGPEQSYGAVHALVRPRTDRRFEPPPRHSGCRAGDAPFHPGTDERAEIWENDSVVQPLGTEVWYRFSMFIDPAVHNGSKRLVIGQWKQSGNRSPIVAQRFTGGAFTITVQHDNNSPARDPRDVECRVVVAADADAREHVGSSHGHHHQRRALVLPSASLLERPVPNYGAEPGQPEPENLTLSKPCADLKLEALGTLPVPFGRWTEMVYHIKATADENGLVEVWADDQPIVRVKGRVGYRTNESASQYFKFGPYRDSESHSTFASLAKYRRGPTREDILD